MLFLRLFASIPPVALGAIAEERVSFVVTRAAVHARVGAALPLLFLLAPNAEETHLAITKESVTFFVTGPPVHTRIRLAVFLFTLFALVAEISILAVAKVGVAFVVANAVVAAWMAAALVGRYPGPYHDPNETHNPRNHGRLFM